MHSFLFAFSPPLFPLRVCPAPNINFQQHWLLTAEIGAWAAREPKEWQFQPAGCCIYQISSIEWWMCFERQWQYNTVVSCDVLFRLQLRYDLVKLQQSKPPDEHKYNSFDYHQGNNNALFLKKAFHSQAHVPFSFYNPDWHGTAIRNWQRQACLHSKATGLWPNCQTTHGYMLCKVTLVLNGQ